MTEDDLLILIGITFIVSYGATLIGVIYEIRKGKKDE